MPTLETVIATKEVHTQLPKMVRYVTIAIRGFLRGILERGRVLTEGVPTIPRDFMCGIVVSRRCSMVWKLHTFTVTRSMDSRLSFPATGPPDPGRVSEGSVKGSLKGSLKGSAEDPF